MRDGKLHGANGTIALMEHGNQWISDGRKSDEGEMDKMEVGGPNCTNDMHKITIGGERIPEKG
jgi:hypothetical protein